MDAFVNREKIELKLKNFFIFLAVFSICFLASCATSQETRKETFERKKKRKRPPISQRTIAAYKDPLFFEESGMDFLSKKLEDTISGYEGLKEKISGLEEKLSRLIFIFERKAQAIVAKKTEPSPLEEGFEEEREEDNQTDKAKEVLPESETTVELEPEQQPSDFSKESMASGGK